MKRLPLLSGIGLALLAGSVLAAPSAYATSTLPNGFTAKVVAHSGQTIHGVIDATGFDLGIYIGPGVHNVRVLGAKVTGANDQGILVQDTTGVVIRNSTVERNALNHPATLSEVKAITLAGTRNVVVTGTTVDGNGDGGIGVYDDGPNSPETFAPVAIDTAAVPSIGNVVTGNAIRDNLAGCGIVVSAKNPGGGVKDTVVALNRVISDPSPQVGPPFTGGIVVAGGSFGAVQVTRTVLVDNTVTGGVIPGISLHASSPGTVSGTALLDNVLSHNGAGAGGQSTGIELAGSPGAISGTQVLYDHVVDDFFGVFHVGDTGTHISHLSTAGVTTRIAP
jgi:parallel beta helix pectate lyase-like protein